MGHVELNKVSYVLPDGRVLLDEITFRVGEGAKAALVGANGAGKTTLLRIVSGDLDPSSGAVTMSGGLGIMRQFVGSVRDDTSVRDLLLSVAPPRVRSAATTLEKAELAMMEADDERTQMRYAQAISDWADAGGYDIEVLWDVCCTEALGVPFVRAQYRDVRTLSGGEQKRIVLEALLRGPDEVLLLDEPDNYLDVPGKRWLEEQLRDDAEDRALRLPRPRAARADGHPGHHRRARGSRQHLLGPRRRLRDVPRGTQGPLRAPRRAEAPLGRGAREAQGARDHVPHQGGLQRRDGEPPAGRRDPAHEVRGGRSAGGPAP